MKLTNDHDYFADTTHISNSMISTYLQSPELYKMMYVDKSYVRHQTPQMQTGTMVDLILTEGMDKFLEQFEVKVLKKDDPKLFEEQKTSNKQSVTQTMYDQALAMSKAVERTAIYKWIKSMPSQSQPMLMGKWKLAFGGDVPIKGKLDWLVLKGDTAYIIDLKTTSTVSPHKYFFHAGDFNYWNQLAVYSELVRQNNPKVKQVICYHLVVMRDLVCPDVQLFLMNADRIESCRAVIDEALYGITVTKNFQPRPMSLTDAIEIGIHKEGDSYNIIEI